MHFLYVDSTSGLVIGLLDSNYKWIEYLNFDEKKPSEIIHIEIFNLLKRHQLDLADLKFFFSSGPGSYTGMRLGEGFAQMLAWDKREVFSFYHFKIPQMCGVEKGFWATNAFKGQVFLYQWKDLLDEGTKELIDNSQFSIVDKKQGYTLINDKDEFKELQSTKDYIYNFPEKVFQNIYLKKIREAPYYFRTLDEEFKNA